MARWLRPLLWFLGFGCLWLPLFDDPPLQSAAFVQDVTDTSGCVAMITPSPTALTLRVREPGGALVSTLQESTASRRHEFLVAGLVPGHEYAWELEGPGARGTGTLHTAPRPGDDRAPVRFAMLGDSGAVPWWVWLQRNALFHLPARWQWLPIDSRVRTAGERLAAAQPDFVLHLGDVVYPFGRHSHWGPGLFRPFAEVMAHAPLYATLGNHDVLDDDGHQLLANLHLPRNPVTGDERCYSFARGAVRVVVLDFNLADTRDAVLDDHPAVAFLRSELPRCHEPWVLVASHFPIRSASRQRDRPDLLLHVLPLLQRYGVDLYAAGHDHTYQRFGEGRDADDVPLIVSGGGGKSLYDIVPGSRAVVAQSVYHWCSVEVNGRRLQLRALGFDGSPIDTLRLDQDRSPERIARIAAVDPERARRIEALLRE